MHLPSPSELEPGLYIVATPIGNLRDITLRALDTLAQADMVLCEDTRMTHKLLSCYNIEQNALNTYNDHSTELERQRIIQAIQEGKSVALVSDAGTPLISDPGYKLVQAAQEANIYVTTTPGASSLTAALTLAALPTNRILFEGFLPPKQQARRHALQHLLTINATLVFFERGSRTPETLSDIALILGNHRQASVVREISKKFEEVKTGTSEQLIEYYNQSPPKGEVVIVVSPPGETNWDEEKITSLLQQLLTDHSVKDAAKIVADSSGWTKKDVYRIALDTKI